MALFTKQILALSCVYFLRRCDHHRVRSKTKTGTAYHKFGDVCVAVSARCAAGGGDFDVWLFVPQDTPASSAIQEKSRIVETQQHPVESSTKTAKTSTAAENARTKCGPKQWTSIIAINNDHCNSNGEKRGQTFSAPTIIKLLPTGSLGSGRKLQESEARFLLAQPPDCLLYRVLDSARSYLSRLPGKRRCTVEGTLNGGGRICFADIHCRIVPGRGHLHFRCPRGEARFSEEIQIQVLEEKGMMNKQGNRRYGIGWGGGGGGKDKVYSHKISYQSCGNTLCLSSHPIP